MLNIAHILTHLKTIPTRNNTSNKNIRRKTQAGCILWKLGLCPLSFPVTFLRTNKTSNTKHRIQTLRKFGCEIEVNFSCLFALF